MPDSDQTPTDQPAATGNRPNFVPSPESDLAAAVTLARENSRLTRELEAALQRAETLEETVKSSDNTELQQQLDALKAENESLKSEKDTLQTQVTTLEGAQQTAAREAALEGKVSDVKLAMRVLDPEKHLDADGNVRVDALLADYASLAPTGPTGATAPDAGGGTHHTASKADEIATARQELDKAQQSGNRVLAVSLQSKLTELEQSQQRQ